MIKEDFNLDYKDFKKEYVVSPVYDFTISFSFKGRYYQFDFVNVLKNKDGSTAYDFIAYDSDWNSPFVRNRYKNLKDAIDNAKIEGLSFEEVYNSVDSYLIDIS